MVEVTAKGKARQVLDGLSSRDIVFLCNVFRVATRGGKKDKIVRLLSQDENRIGKLLVFARLIRLGYDAEVHIGKESFRALLAKDKLPISGNRHRLYLTLIENGRLSVSDILALLNPNGLRHVYTSLFDKPALDSEIVLRNEIENWVNEKTPMEQPPRIGMNTVVRQPSPQNTDMTYGPWGIPHARAVSTVSGKQDSTIMKAEASAAKEFDVAISYASEDAGVAKVLAERLRDEQVSVFYDEFFKADLWGKSLSTRFKEAFGEKTEFVLILVSKHYAVKNWTDFEFSIARGEAKTRKVEFILPIRLDDTPMAGLRSDVLYMDLRKDPMDGIVRDFKQKLETRRRLQAERKPNPFLSLIPS
jgi:hypothetical protein